MTELAELQRLDVVGTFPSDKSGVCITNFRPINPEFRSSQEALQAWLIDAHLQSRNASGDLTLLQNDELRRQIRLQFSRYSASSCKIGYRWHELADFTHRRWQEMVLFDSNRDMRASDISRKMDFFRTSTLRAFEKFFPENSAPPPAIIHVTCTGYCAPSAAQQLVSKNDWGNHTHVYHAYHMGCYAAHPAVRLGAAFVKSLDRSAGAAEIVHTELCSLHLNLETNEPAQMVIQSLFADGYMAYSLQRSETTRSDRRRGPALDILWMRDEVIPDSTDAMSWSTGPSAYKMKLDKEVPDKLTAALPQFLTSLFREAGLDPGAKETAVFAIHPGGPRIIDGFERALCLTSAQTRYSREILYERGNMSSATLPFIWQRILEAPEVPTDTLIVSLGAGPGLTLSGALFLKRG
jgi:predicted naringenin-chalcone synthase